MPLKALQRFIKEVFPGRFDEWLRSLPEESRAIHSGLILDSSWYSFEDAWITPNRMLAKLFYDSDPRGCWERGRYNADVGLRGIYKVFVRLGSPQFIVSRAGKLFSTLWSGVRVETEKIAPNEAVMSVYDVPEMETYAEHGVAGFVERALEISGCNNVEVEIARSMADSGFSRFSVRWQ